MDARVLIETLEHRGLHIAVVGDKVHVSGSREPDAETKALLHELREQRDAVKAQLLQPDPIITVEEWYPHFRDFHRRVIRETPNFDYLWLRKQHPDLYREIKTKEAEIDALGPARLLEVMATMAEWRRLIVEAEFERRRDTKR
jgi:hypothetical protein